MRCLNGLEQPDSGQIRINGVDLMSANRAQKRELLRSIGTVFQSVNLLSRRTVFDNIALPIEWLGKVDTTSVIALARMVGLEDKLSHYPSQLSGGQQQRVAIARALAIKPKFLLCDEFTSALDPETTLEILALLRQLNLELGVSVLMITHDMSVVREICDIVYVMENGEIIESGSIEEILTNPQHSITKSLLSHLFIKDLPNKIAAELMSEPRENCDALIRLMFSGDSSHQPVITNVIQQYHITVNIISGNIDHVRETAFGSLIIRMPFKPDQLEKVLKHFAQHRVAAEILGYIGRSDS
jgi:D-methionine transport system ATP-binding protein